MFRLASVLALVGLLAAPRCASALPGAAAPEAAGHWRGVFFNPQVEADPNFPWLLYYTDYRATIQQTLKELHAVAGLNLVAVFVMIPNSLRVHGQGNRADEPSLQWANTGFLENVAAFVDDCHEAGMQAELDLVDNRWIPYSIDSSNHIGKPGNPWWPVAGNTPWIEAAAWYRQMIEAVEKRAKHPGAIAYWCMMGNYTWGAAEPVLWNDESRPAIRTYTEQFVKHVWPVFRRSGKRPKAAPILLPIFADDAYWRTKTPMDRLAGFTNLKRWLLDDLKLAPDYWVMSTYPFCDPAPDGFRYLRKIVEILGPKSARRLVSTDLKGIGHEDELRASIVKADGRTGSDILRWHVDKCAAYGFAGWWMWAYQDTPASKSGLRTLDGKWKTELLEITRAGEGRR